MYEPRLALRRIESALLAFGVITVAGVLGYMVFEGWSFTDALYMTVITLTTVGYREVRTLDATGQLCLSPYAVGGKRLASLATQPLIVDLLGIVIRGEEGTFDTTPSASDRVRAEGYPHSPRHSRADLTPGAAHGGRGSRGRLLALSPAPQKRAVGSVPFAVRIGG